MNNKYLLEVGVEEIPARYVDEALKQLINQAEKKLEENRIAYLDIKGYSTPRRLSLIIEGLDDRQESLEELLRGPSKKIAFDENGEPSKALQGFMKGQDLSIDDIEIKDYKGEDYVFANHIENGEPIDKILPKIVPEMIKGINFPKTMKWGGKNFRFIRPIRWIVSILNNELLSFELENIPVGIKTRGHRFLGKQEIKILDIDQYKDLLEENYVLVDSEERKDKIIIESERLVKERGGNLDRDKDLLDEITNIVEYPTALIGKIKPEYLDLPKEVIITPMKEHQRYIPVLDDKGRLLPYFITVRNGNKEHIENVAKGNEKVLGARLEDAKFFFKEDISRPLESYVEGLEKVIFQNKLGNMMEKTRRLQLLSEEISKDLEVGDETEANVKRAAYLSKADLITMMVDEFSELQGIMGEKYAQDSGENEIVSIAIREQYLPRYSGDDLPSTTAGLILSLADKIDNICGSFAIDVKPTGSQDPHGLRRQALGIINIILDKKLDLSLSDLIETSLYIYVEENGLAFDSNKVKEEIYKFFNIRIKNIFLEKSIRHDVIDAIVGSNIDGVADMEVKAREITQWLEDNDVKTKLEAFNRVSNLAEKTDISEINPDLFGEEENILYSRFKTIRGIVEDLISEDKYNEALLELSTLEIPINNFFDKVMVMVDDEKIKNNRLALLKNINNLSLKICDLSKIVF